MQVCVPEEQEITVNISKVVPVQKQATRTVYTSVPVTTEIDVPVTTFTTEARKGVRTVAKCVPHTEMVTQCYRVCVPYTETITVPVGGYGVRGGCCN